MSETYEYEGPKCPHCGRQFTADENYYFDESNFTELECDECGKTSHARVNISTTWTCWPMDAPSDFSTPGDGGAGAPVHEGPVSTAKPLPQPTGGEET